MSSRTKNRGNCLLELVIMRLLAFVICNLIKHSLKNAELYGLSTAVRSQKTIQVKNVKNDCIQNLAEFVRRRFYLSIILDREHFLGPNNG